MANDTAFPFDTKTLPAITAPAKTPSDIFGRSAFKGLQPSATAPAAGGFGAENVPGSREAQFNAESVQGLRNEQGTPNPSGFVPSMPSVYVDQKPVNTGFYAQNRMTAGLPAITPETPASAPAQTAAAAVRPPTQPPKELSNFEKAKAYSTASPDQRPEVVGTRFQRAYTGLNQETAAQAQATKASGAAGGGGILDLDETTTYNQQMQPETKTKHYGILDASGALQRLNLPTIEKKVTTADALAAIKAGASKVEVNKRLVAAGLPSV